MHQCPNYCFETLMAKRFFLTETQNYHFDILRAYFHLRCEICIENFRLNRFFGPQGELPAAAFWFLEHYRYFSRHSTYNFAFDGTKRLFLLPYEKSNENTWRIRILFEPLGHPTTQPIFIYFFVKSAKSFPRYGGKSGTSFTLQL